MLIWKNRLPKLRGKIQDSNADIVCLQEISLGYFQSKHGYDYRLNPSCGRADSGIGGDFTTAIMFKSSKFECVHCRESKRICLYHSFFVVNVHLESKSDRESARINALKSILKRIRFCLSEKLKINNVDKEAANVRILMMGDFNSGVENAPSLMLLNANDDEKKHPFHFQEAYLDKMVQEQYQNEFKSSESLEMDEVNLRIKHHPSYILNDRAYSIDLMFYTADNVTLHGVGNAMDEKLETQIKWKEKCTERIKEWMESGKTTNKDEQWHLAG